MASIVEETSLDMSVLRETVDVLSCSRHTALFERASSSRSKISCSIFKAGMPTGGHVCGLQKKGQHKRDSGQDHGRPEPEKYLDEEMPHSQCSSFARRGASR